MIVSPLNCSEKMSPYEGDSDIDKERTGEVGSVEPGGSEGIGGVAGRGDTGGVTAP